MSAVWVVTSAGLRLPVTGPQALARWWPRIVPQVPGADPCLMAGTGEDPALVLPDSISPGDARRRICAAVHAGHLGRGTISVHAVALVRDGLGVLLLGGHGSGKSLTGLALVTAHGWQPAAGDVCLIRTGQDGPARIVGGSHSWIVRRRETGYWFPGIAVPGSGPHADLACRIAPWYQPAGQDGARLAAMVSVSAGDSPQLLLAERQPAHVGLSAVCRASSYLIDKVLDDPGAEPLRLAETAALSRARERLARRVAAGTGSWRMGGTPHAIAAEISRLTAEPAGKGGLQ